MVSQKFLLTLWFLISLTACVAQSNNFEHTAILQNADAFPTEKSSQSVQVPQPTNLPATPVLPSILITPTPVPTIDLTRLVDLPTVSPIPTSTPMPTSTPIPVGEIAFNTTVIHAIELNTIHAWTFQGFPGQVIKIRMDDDNSGIDPYLKLYGVDGELLGFNEDGSTYHSYAFMWERLPARGSYTIIGGIRGERGGDYTLNLIDETPPYMFMGEINYAIVDGDAIIGIQEQDFTQTWEFEGTQGETIEVLLEFTVETSTWFSLIDETDGQILADASPYTLYPGTDRMIEATLGPITLPNTGKYTIVLQGEPNPNFRPNSNVTYSLILHVLE